MRNWQVSPHKYWSAHALSAQRYYLVDSRPPHVLQLICRIFKKEKQFNEGHHITTMGNVEIL